MVILAESEKAINEMLKDMNKAHEEYGMKINKKHGYKQEMRGSRDEDRKEKNRTSRSI